MEDAKRNSELLQNLVLKQSQAEQVQTTFPTHPQRFKHEKPLDRPEEKVEPAPYAKSDDLKLDLSLLKQRNEQKFVQTTRVSSNPIIEPIIAASLTTRPVSSPINRFECETVRQKKIFDDLKKSWAKQIVENKNKGEQDQIENREYRNRVEEQFEQSKNLGKQYLLDKRQDAKKIMTENQQHVLARRSASGAALHEK